VYTSVITMFLVGMILLEISMIYKDKPFWTGLLLLNPELVKHLIECPDSGPNLNWLSAIAEIM
jgi:hypothetical protein